MPAGGATQFYIVMFRMTEAGWTYAGTVAARQAARRNIVPTRVLKPAEQGVAQMGGWQLAKLPVRGLGDRVGGLANLLVGGAQQR